MTSWHRKAACAGLPLSLFFGGEEERGHAKANREDRARQVCSRCPVRVDCLLYATRRGEHGFWGGRTEDERRGKRRRDLSKTPQHAQETT